MYPLSPKKVGADITIAIDVILMIFYALRCTNIVKYMFSTPKSITNQLRASVGSRKSKNPTALAKNQFSLTLQQASIIRDAMRLVQWLVAAAVVLQQQKRFNCHFPIQFQYIYSSVLHFLLVNQFMFKAIKRQLLMSIQNNSFEMFLFIFCNNSL